MQTTTTPQNTEPLPQMRDALVHLVCSAQILLNGLMVADPEHADEYRAAYRGLVEVDMNMGPFEE